MSRARKQERALSDEDHARLIALIKDADSVELKLTVPEADHRSAVTALGMDPLEAQIRQVFFFDTPDLALDEHGRRRSRSPRAEKGRRLCREAAAGRPVRAPGRRPPVAGFRRRGGRDAGRIRLLGLDEGERSAPPTSGRPWPASGRCASCSRRSSGPSTPSTLPRASRSTTSSVLGPIFVLKLKFVPEEFDRKLVAEMWLYPDNSRILELSTKCRPAEAFQVAAEARAFLTEQGIDLGGEQETKTRKALEFFSKRLQAKSKVPAAV